ncbi:MAG TPA: M3 family metallopeptidase [Flavobacteriaceae bacterium]|nr:M3 family metallopeptidase [Flavobacteriaceae bacterium]
MNNPLLQAFEWAPFSKIKEAHFSPAIKELIEQAKQEIQAIAENTDAPNFENTIEAMEGSGEQLGRVTSIFFNLNNAETNETIQEIAQEVSPLLSEFQNDILLNSDLYARVKTVFDKREELDLNPEQSRLLEKNYLSFSRNGAGLNDEDKKVLREIDTKLSKLSLNFGQNVLADTNAYQLHLTEEKELEGLSESAKEAAAELAQEKELEGWIITLDFPSYVPFMTYAKNRELRKEIALAYGARGFQDNKFNNEKIVLEIVNLRHKRAKLLGYRTHADFVLEQRMAKSPEGVIEFLEDLKVKAKPSAIKQRDELADFAKELDGITPLQKWDSAYYSEKLKQKLFAIDDELLRPYFQLDRVLDGVFTISKKLFGLSFQKRTDVDTYHPDVTVWQVTDANGKEMGLLYTDFHPRPGKRNGAWKTSYRSQEKKNGKDIRPHISIVCNFSRPSKDKPSLLTFNEVTTLFHEFGHALHGLLANTTYSSLSGTSVYWDFVELPSQLLENWCYEKEALSLFAKHYKTDELIPMEYVERIQDLLKFQEGLQTLRQLSFGILDMTWHNNDPSTFTDVKEVETKAFESTQLYPDVAENCMSTAFSHIFQGGYSAGYYSYKWAEVLDADAFAYFKENGIFNKEIAKKFNDHVLSQGGTKDPMELYKAFRGQEPSPDALLKRAGLIE